MNGFFYFIVTICLIAIGLLIGWIVSAAAGNDTWAALGAIGSWVGGLGAFAAAGVAVYIAYRQEKRDTYKLHIEGYDVKQSGATFLKTDEQGNEIPDRGPGHLKLKAFNTGMRQIELIKVIYRYENSEFYIQMSGVLVEAGRQTIWEFKDAIFITSELGIFPIYSNRLLDFQLRVMDAAGVIHDVTTNG